MPARLCLLHSDGECLPPRPRTSDELCLRRSSHQAPTDGGASLWAAPQCEVEVDSRCLLVSASGTRMESACHCNHATAMCSFICEEAAMKLRKEVIVEDNALSNRVLSVW